MSEKRIDFNCSRRTVAWFAAQFYRIAAIIIFIGALVSGIYWLALSLCFFIALVLIIRFVKSRKIKSKIKFHYVKPILSFLLIMFLAIFFRLFVFEIYKVPSNSMAETLKAGDFIFVNKLKYGPRLPRNIKEIPWLNLFYFFGKNTASSNWKYKRLSGISKIKNGDILVFNSVVNKNEFTVKRCVALPGDTLEIKNGCVYYSNTKEDFTQLLKYPFWIYSENTENLLNVVDSLGIDVQGPLFKYKRDYVQLNLSTEQMQHLFELSYVDKIIPSNRFKDSINQVYPWSESLFWSIDNYGPIIIPKKGKMIQIDYSSYMMYKHAFKNHENIDLIEQNEAYLFNNNPITHYKFSKDYYFLIGDNRHDSVDSRYWGFLPEENIIGKATLVLFNVRNNKINWNRILYRIR